jgi:riboflavin synthase
MFTGIIEELGKVERIQHIGGGIHLTIQAPQSADELQVNDSVAINGVCQTVVRKNNSSFEVEAVEETLKKTTFESLKVGAPVNLELPMKLNERLGGHLVLGHVDTVGQIIQIDRRESSWIFKIQFPLSFEKYVVTVGSIAIDGVSLTIAEASDSAVKVSIIPHTMENTLFKFYKLNDKVNLEFDVIGKYVERMMPGSHANQSEKTLLSVKHLSELGF